MPWYQQPYDPASYRMDMYIRYIVVIPGDLPDGNWVANIQMDLKKAPLGKDEISIYSTDLEDASFKYNQDDKDYRGRNETVRINYRQYSSYGEGDVSINIIYSCLLYTSPSPRDS